MPVCVAGHQCSKSNCLSVLSKRGQDRIALKHWLFGGPKSWELVEVVHYENPVETGSFCRLGLRNNGVENARF